MRTRVVYLDTGNRKLLWRQALEHALLKPERPPIRPHWWNFWILFFRELFTP
jgi:hypothetical protein